MKSIFSIMIAAAVLAAPPVFGQTSTWSTTKKDNSKSATDTKTWQSPDGTRRTTNSTTSTKSNSTSIGVGITAPPPGPPPGGFGAIPLTGSWNVTIADGRGCMLSLYRGTGPGAGGGANASGCGSTDLADVGNWTSPDGGHSITLTKFFVVPVATLRRTGPQRFDGTLGSGARVTVWR